MKKITFILVLITVDKHNTYSKYFCCKNTSSCGGKRQQDKLSGCSALY